MVESVYSPTPAKIKAYFDKIQEVSVPPKVNREYLKSLGFKSGNDQYFISILKFLGFIDSSNIPTDRWSEYRAKAKAKEVMATALKSSYVTLFKTYEDAFRKDRQTLRDFFSAQTKLGSATVELMVRTFEELCKLADFEAPAIVPTPTPAVPAPTPSLEVVKKPLLEAGAGLVINLNISLELPATQDASVYDKIFKSLKEHLLARD